MSENEGLAWKKLWWNESWHGWLCWGKTPFLFLRTRASSDEKNEAGSSIHHSPELCSFLAKTKKKQRRKRKEIMEISPKRLGSVGW